MSDGTDTYITSTKYTYVECDAQSTTMHFTDTNFVHSQKVPLLDPSSTTELYFNFDGFGSTTEDIYPSTSCTTQRVFASNTNTYPGSPTINLDDAEKNLNGTWSIKYTGTFDTVFDISFYLYGSHLEGVSDPKSWVASSIMRFY